MRTILESRDLTAVSYIWRRISEALRLWRIAYTKEAKAVTVAKANTIISAAAYLEGVDIYIPGQIFAIGTDRNLPLLARVLERLVREGRGLGA